jgi:serine/threonine-protein kinase
LSIDTYPWSRVTIDGRAAGDTPIVTFAVKPGAHTLVFENPETGLRETRTVTVKPNEHLSRRFAFE